MTDNFDKILEDKNAHDTQQFLTFTISGEEYGVDIMTVREIKGWTETTRLPNSPKHVRGVMNLRGLIIPIFDLRARFGGELTNATVKNVVIILAIAERNIGILVDAVSDILTVGNDEVKAAPDTNSQLNSNYINGLISLENRMVVILAVEKLFGTELQQAEMNNLNAA